MIEMLPSAFLPAFFVVYLIYKIDDYQEPLIHLLWAFVLGVLSPLVTLMISAGLNFNFSQGDDPWMYALTMAAIPEELGRFIILWWMVKNWREIAEPFDCIVYGAAIWGGFSAIENLLYGAQGAMKDQSPFVILSVRSTLCTLGHISWGIILGGYVGIARFGENNSKNWALRGLLITITLHMAYDALLFSVNETNFWYTSLLALSVDAISVMIAILFIIRLEEIQGISLDEGDKADLQAELLKRHRPTSSVGMYEILTHFGLWGLFIVLLTMTFSSLTVFHLNQIFLLADPKYLLSSGLFAVLAALCWKKTLSIAMSIHEETEEALDEDLHDAMTEGDLDA